MSNHQTETEAMIGTRTLANNTTNTLNNFDIIRLFAALEVAISHTASHLNIELPAIFHILGYFPGVPIFFFISGYLIYQSYSNIQEAKIKVFFINRFLRLYPALYFCFFITILSLYLSGYLKTQDYTFKDFGVWTFTSLTFFQFYNPDFLREYGVGAINGSLWTISVELQFYILTPLLFILYNKHKKAGIAIASLFIFANLANTLLNDRSSIAIKLFGVSFVPWFYMFMAGAYISISPKIQKNILSVNAFVFLILYLASYFIASKYSLGTGNAINVVSYILLCFLVFKLAFTKPTLSRKLLRGDDISYGIYIYHMPIVNLMLFYGIQATTSSFITAVMATVTTAIISWFFIEKPSLRLKKITLRKYA
jgi:peptidoglycan/LPS O-acetylase OafA/YrhL